MKQPGDTYWIDPELRAALERTLGSALMTATLDDDAWRDVVGQRARRAATARTMAEAAELTPEAAMVEQQDRLIPSREPDRSIGVRIYRPRMAAQARPAMIFFHGGAYVRGDLNSEHHRCIQYAARAEIVVVSVDYRLAPENPYPAGLEDCYDALQWTANHAADLAIDPNRLAVGGASSGAGLAATLALLARDKGGPSLRFQCLVVPPLDDRMESWSMTHYTDVPLWTSGMCRYMWSYYRGDQPADSELTYFAAARAKSLDALPRTYLLTADLDPFRDEGAEYASRLMRSGVPTDYHNVAGAFHGFDIHFVQCAISLDALVEQITSIRRHL